MNNLNLSIPPWADYELIDSGLNRKLERYGKYVLIRPETQALWKPAHPEIWNSAQSEFRFAEGKGFWRGKSLPESWEISWEDIRFSVRLTSFKHTGVFPEQAANWTWIKERVKSLKNAQSPKVLNLFGYTGIASIVAAQAGAQVTHVDASKTSNTWGHENAERSGIAGEGLPTEASAQAGIRWITDDALKFVEREVRRGNVYDGIILDPPAFGRGAKGEVWHIEEDLPQLLEILKKLLSPRAGSFFLLNGYAAGYAPQSLFQAVAGIFGNQEGEFGELRIEESHSKRCIPSGIYVRFVR